MGKCKFLRVGLLVVASALALGSAAFFGCSQAGEPEHTHSYKAVVTPPTCTERGYTTYSCECGDSYVDSYVNALGHNLTEHSGQAATCTQSGWNNYVTCSRCDYTTYTALPAKGHTPSAPVRGNETPASCTSEGSYDEVVYCTVCDTEISRTPHTVAKLAHTPSAPVRENETPASCTSEGSYDEVVYCTVCDTEISRTPHTVAKLAHTPSAPVRENETPASCTSEGSYDEVVYCSVCDTEISRTHKIIEKLPHKYVNRVCEVCGAIDGLIAFATLDVNGYQVSGTLSNDTAVFSFINEVTVDDGATYTVCTDMACTQVIPSKTVNLNVGDNIYYILVSQGNDVQLYTVTLRRHPIYSVTFNTDGGTSVEAQEVEEESYLHAPEEPQKEGYTFVEWQFEDQTVTFPVQVMENMQLTAIYTANIYDITLDVNGGEPLDEAEYEATFDGVYTLPVPQREGYTFLGWYESDIAVTAASGNSLSVWKYTDNMQLEARWSINSYALSLDKNIDEAGSISGDGENVFDSQVTVTAQTNAGYTFLGWFSGEELLSEEPEYTFAMPAEDIALTAKWEVNSYMLTLDENIDEAGDALGGGEKEYNSQVTVTAQANAGYTFLGWYDGEKLLSQEREYTFVMPAEALNLTARWSINSYVLALDKNIDGAGSVSDGGEQVYNSQVTITAQTNLGYTFLGWYNGEELLSEEPKYTFAMPAQQLTLTAKWQINEEIADFTFTSTPTTCTITGLTDESLNQVTIPDYVTSIGSSAFEDCTSLESVEIPSSVTSIGYRAFRDCGSLTSIIIPSSITYIGSYAFENCTSLTAVYITDLEAWCNISFDSVSSNPLYYAHNLYLNGELVTDIVIPDGVTSIDYAFYNCTSLTSITIPSSVASIGTSHPFWGCSKLIIYCEAAEKPYSWNSEWNYYVNYQACPVVWDCNNNSTDESGYSYSVIDGLRYGFKNGTAAVALQSVTISGDIVISSSVTYNGAVYPVTGIMRRAFYNCGGLTGITIPSSVTIIDGNAFEGCDGLETVYITDLGAWCNIIFDGSYYTNPLYYAHNLYLNGELVTELVIPEGVTDIGEYVFYGCTSITSVTLPASVTNIGYYAFENCTSLTAVYITDLEAWCNISFGYFSSNPLTYAHNLYLNGELVTGELVIPEGATNIGSYAFSGCNTLTGITIPLTVTSIGEGAFSGCSSLESITLPFVGGSANAESESGSTLFGYIFGTSSYSGGTATEQSIRISSSSSKIVTYYIPSSLKNVIIMGGEVLYGAFCNCSNITSVTLLDGITSIGYCAFRDCGSLTSITIPSSITYIDSYAFDGCNGLDVVNITGLKAWCNISFDSVSSNPLYYAHNLYLNGELLTDIVIPEGVTRIGAYTFKGYKALTSIIIPSTVTSIDEGAFSGCSSLGSIALPFVGGSANAESESGSTLFGYIFGTSSYSGGTATEQSIRISSSSSKIVTYYIPSSLKNVTITGGNILDGAFYNCSNLTSINIPSDITSIAANAFYGCTSLTNIAIPSSVTSIGSRAFRNCSSLESITIPSGVTNIEEAAFSGCAALAEINFNAINCADLRLGSGWSYSFSNIGANSEGIVLNIGANVQRIPQYLLYNCSRLVRVEFAEGSVCTVIGDYAFIGCSGLQSIALPSSVTSIGSRAFSGCSSLISVSLSEGLTSIELHAFKNCSNLTEITIPSSVTSIGDSAFNGCSLLENAVFIATSGWSVSRTGSEEISISSYYLANSSSAATYLRLTYSSYYWKRG